MISLALAFALTATPSASVCEQVAAKFALTQDGASWRSGAEGPWAGAAAGKAFVKVMPGHPGKASGAMMDQMIGACRPEGAHGARCDLSGPVLFAVVVRDQFVRFTVPPGARVRVATHGRDLSCEAR